LARCENVTQNSRLAGNIARKRDALRALGGNDLHVTVFGAVVVRVCARHPARRNLAFGRIFLLVRVRVSPKHELLDDEEHAEPDHQGGTDGMRSAWPDALHRLRQ